MLCIRWSLLLVFLLLLEASCDKKAVSERSPNNTLAPKLIQPPITSFLSHTQAQNTSSVSGISTQMQLSARVDSSQTESSTIMTPTVTPPVMLESSQIESATATQIAMEVSESETSTTTETILTSCEIAVSNCPSDATVLGAFVDNYSAPGVAVGTVLNQSQCMQRATDYYTYCGGSPANEIFIIATATFVSNGVSIQTKTVPSTAKFAMFSPFSLQAGSSISFNGIALTMQADGDLVVTQNSNIVWSSGTDGKNCTACVAKFQSEGNIILLDKNGDPYWYTSKENISGAMLQISTTVPYLEILSGYSAVWASSAIASFPQPLIDLTKLTLPAAGVAVSSALTASSNTTYSGLRISNSSGPCITISGVTTVTVQNSEIGPCGGAGIEVDASSSITISGNHIHNTIGVGVEISGGNTISVTQNQIEEVASGIYAASTTGGIVVTNNRVLNVQGPFPRGQLAQFNGVNGSGNSISCNQGQNILGQSNPEDEINIFNCLATTDSFLMVFGNKILGGGPSQSGGGIISGDGGSGGFITTQNNILVNPGQYGISVPGSSTINLYNNYVYGKSQSFTNIGLYVWNQYATACSNISVAGNIIEYYNATGAASSGWNGGGTFGGTATSACTPAIPAGWTSNSWNDGILSPSIINSVVTGCTYK